MYGTVELPDKVYVISDLSEKYHEWDEYRRLCVFRTLKRAEKYLKTLINQDRMLIETTWEEIVATYSNEYYQLFAVIDHEGVGINKSYESMPIV